MSQGEASEGWCGGRRSAGGWKGGRERDDLLVREEAQHEARQAPSLDEHAQRPPILCLIHITQRRHSEVLERGLGETEELGEVCRGGGEADVGEG